MHLKIDWFTYLWSCFLAINFVTGGVENKDLESVLSEPLSYQEQDKDATLTKQKKHDSNLQFYSDGEETFCPSPLPLPNYSFTNTLKYDTNNMYAHPRNNFIERLPGSYSNESVLDNEVS